MKLKSYQGDSIEIQLLDILLFFLVKQDQESFKL
jgi:hypothetical protein